MGYLATNESNWASDASNKEHRKQTIKSSIERKRYEKKLIKEGKRQVLIPHPDKVRCFIVKFE